MSEREWPTEQDLLNGKMPDGSRPPLHSRSIYDLPDNFPDHDAELRVKDRSAERLRLAVEKQLHGVYDRVAKFAEQMMEIGRSASGAGSAKPIDTKCPPAVVSEANDNDSTSDEPSPDDCRQDARATPKGYTNSYNTFNTFRIGANPKTTRVTEGGGIVPPVPCDADEEEIKAMSQVADECEALLDYIDRSSSGAGSAQPIDAKCPPVSREPARDNMGEDVHPANTRHNAKLKFEVAIAIGERGAKLLLNAAEKRAASGVRIIDLCTKLDNRDKFMHDRAHAVTHCTLMHMDESLRECGFTGWMPFRWPDQWLMFIGLMRRILAANGLIHSKHASVYRRLMEETPLPENDARPPQNWSQCWVNRGACTMDELRARIKEEEDLEKLNKPPPRTPE